MKYKITNVLVLCFLLSSCSTHKLTKKGVYKELPPKVYYEYIKDSLVNIIDLRTPKEYQKGHIEGAINISYFGNNFKEKLQTINLDTTITTLIYCETQHRSLMAANKLYKTGFSHIIDLDKGMRFWRKNKLPLQKNINK